MSYRTVVIKNRVKLELSLNYLVCRGDRDIKINLDEISTLIIQNIACSLTACLLNKLIERKINIIFCDEKSNPTSQLIPLHGSYDSYSKLKKQISWNDSIKGELWKLIIIKKIRNQADNLKIYKLTDACNMLIHYSDCVTIDDETNREGHAAKVYFNSLFGNDFSRKDSSIDINAFLNYGYSIILSAINREITSFGYLTQLGIHHIGESNSFNLSCDLMEPLRPLVDLYILKNNIEYETFKSSLSNLLNIQVLYDSKNMYLENAIHLYVQNCLSFLNKEKDTLLFIDYDF